MAKKKADPVALDGPAEKAFESLAKAQLARAGITSARMFGSTALKVGGKVFAVLYKGRLVLKLSEEEVATIVRAKEGVLFDPGHGRTSPTWVSLDPATIKKWPTWTDRAKAYVSQAAKAA